MSLKDEMPSLEIPSKKEDKKSELNKLIFTKDKILIGNYLQCPGYLRDNDYIKEGYRLNCDSMPKVLKSLCLIHNETVNIWSHIIGAVASCFFVLFIAAFISSQDEMLINVIDYQNMIYEIRDITNPWIQFLNENNCSDDELISVVKIIKDNTDTFFKEITNRYNLTIKIQMYVVEVEGVIKKSQEKLEIEKSKVFLKDLSKKWKVVQSKLLEIVSGFGIKFDKSKKINEIKIGDDSQDLHRWPLLIMCGSAILCLGFSAVFHWVGPLSPSVYKVLSRLDYAGISLLIAGSCFPPYFYFFYCETFLCFVYLCFISIFAICVFIFTLEQDFHVPRRRRLRGTLFLTLGLSAAIPLLHLALFGDTVSGYEKAPHLGYWFLGGVSYVVGALMYIKRIPEKLKPGKFDYFGASHQILHFLVVLGVIFHFLGSLKAYYYRLGNSCPNNFL